MHQAVSGLPSASACWGGRRAIRDSSRRDDLFPRAPFVPASKYSSSPLSFRPVELSCPPRYRRSVTMRIEEKLAANGTGPNRRSKCALHRVEGRDLSPAKRVRALARFLSRCLIRAKYSPAPSNLEPPVSNFQIAGSSRRSCVLGWQIDTRSCRNNRKLLKTLTRDSARSIHFRCRFRIAFWAGQFGSSGRGCRVNAL